MSYKDPMEKLLLTDEALTPEEKAQAAAVIEEAAARLFEIDDEEARTENPAENRPAGPSQNGGLAASANPCEKHRFAARVGWHNLEY